MPIVIIAVVIAIMILVALKDWAEDHLPQIICVVLFLLAWRFLGLVGAVILALAVALLIKVGTKYMEWRRAKNETALNKYLEKNCRSMGYMTSKDWNNQLPKFSSRSYTTSFEHITDSFARKVENEFFVTSSDLSWVDPYIHYLITNIMAPVYELEKIPNPALQVTHVTPDAKLIYTALSGLSKYKLIDGIRVLETVQLDNDAVRPFLSNVDGNNIPEYYLTSFKLSESIMQAHNLSSDNFESEELSLDDLESLV